MVERQRGRGSAALIRESSGHARGPIMGLKAPAITNGHTEDADIEDPYLVKIAGDAELDHSEGEGNFDFVPDEKDQALDTTSLHLREIGRIPIQPEMHKKWGEEISAGKMALGALEMLMGSEDCLSEEDGTRVSEVLRKGRFLLRRLHKKIELTDSKIRDNKYEGEKGEKMRSLDIEFLETVSGNEELAKDMLEAWAINKDGGSEGNDFRQLLDQQIILAEQGIRSFNNLIEANLRLPVSIARKYSRVKGMSFDDLTGYGHEGLLLAAADWDIRMGYQFSTYATWWIEQRISRRIDSEGSMIRVPVGIAKELRRRKREQNGAGGNRENPPLPEILQSGLKVQGVVSLDSPFSTEGDSTLLDVLEDQGPGVSDIVLGKISREDVRRILAKVLKEREIRVLQLRLGLLEGTGAMSLEKVGNEFGVTRERIRQIQKKALKKLSRNPEAVKALRALAEP